MLYCDILLHHSLMAHVAMILFIRKVLINATTNLYL